MNKKFYVCRHCDNLIEKIHDAGVSVICCGEKMTELVPNTTEAAGEKHLPVVTVEDGAVYVNVGSLTHPMSAEHHIAWVYLETQDGGMRHDFQPTDAPEFTFCTQNSKPVAVYAYCNLHGLWKTEI